jgi:hypothetical protein
LILTLPTAFFPPVAYMALCLKADEVVIEAEETYTKQTCRNHCSIYGPNGRQLLSIPVKKVNGNHTKTRDIRIVNDLPWQKNHWRSIETAYNQSPFFLYYRDEFEQYFINRADFLLDFNIEILETLFRVLRADKILSRTREFDPSSVSPSKEKLISKKFNPELTPYTQVFSTAHGFLPNLSVLDCLFNLGPETGAYLEAIH